MVNKAYHMKRICMLSLGMLLMLMVFSIVPAARAGAEEKTKTAAIAPSFAENSKTLYVGWKKYCSEIKNVSERAIITYKSSNRKIASVDQDGQITGVKAGTATIIAKIRDNGVTYSIQMNVTVKNPYSKISSSVEGLSLKQSFRFELTRYGHREPVTWTLEGKECATIKAVSATDCILTATAPGTVTLKAESNGTTIAIDVKIYDGTGDIYYISPSSDPYNKAYKKYGTYNKKTKGYYLIRSYLEHIEAEGKGVLVLRKGTYTVTNTLCIPSNCTIILEDGAKIVKSNDTGTTALKPNGSLFQTVSYKHAAQTGIFSGYDGEKNITLIGEGNATIDLASLNCVGLVVAHIINLKVYGLRFINMDTNHFIELDAALNVYIKGNYFSGYAQDNITRKEAINIDTPDLATGGFSQNWTSYDGTPVQNVFITDNVFYSIECGVGTHKYTEGKTHKNVQILRNTFINMDTYAIRVMNWDKPIIQDNTFMLTHMPENDPEDERIGIVVNGSNLPIITNNRFEQYTTPISIFPWKNTGKGRDYAPIYNTLEGEQFIALRSNYVHNCQNNYVEYFKVLDNNDKDAEDENDDTSETGDNTGDTGEETPNDGRGGSRVPIEIEEETYLECTIFPQYIIK